MTREEARPERAPRKQRDDDGPDADALGAYLRSIRDLPVLPHEEINALAAVMERQEAAFRAALLEIPGTAVELASRWSERRAAGLVTGLLAARFRDGSGRDWSRHIDRTLGTVASLLEERSRLRAQKRPPKKRVADLAGRIARASADAEVELEVLLEIHRHFRALLAAPHAEVADEKRRLELNTPGARAAMRRAARALEAHDAAKQRFVRHNLRLVVNLAKRYRNMGVPFMDLLQEGNLGLIRAVEKFDRHRGYRFSTYAVWWITQSLIRVIQNQSRTVRAPSHIYDLHYRQRRAEADLRQRLGRAPTHEELAEKLEVTPETLRRAVDSMKPVASLQGVLPGNEDRTLEDAIEDPEVVDPTEGIEQEATASRIQNELAGLDARERRILELRFGLGGEDVLTLQEIGERLGLSRERVRQIESRALRRLAEREEVRALVA